MVAHRLSTVMMADRIVVMEAGRVRAVGTDAEPVDEDALSRKPAATQLPTAAADGGRWRAPTAGIDAGGERRRGGVGRRRDTR